jgi:hypothetical protein
VISSGNQAWPGVNGKEWRPRGAETVIAGKDVNMKAEESTEMRAVTK